MAFEALIGGAAGGGKSEALRADVLRVLEFEHQRWKRGDIRRSKAHMIHFRRTMPRLQQSVNMAHVLYAEAAGGYDKLQYSDKYHTFTFPCGLKVQFGQMEHTNDYMNYLGHEYVRAYYDELTEFLEDQYVWLVFSRIRTSDPALKPFLGVRSGTNPLGIGLEWVRKRFVEVAPAGTTVRERIKVPQVTHVDGKPVRHTVTVERDRIFFPSTIFDNPWLGPEYAASLEKLDPATKKALMYGDWYAVRGAFLGDLWDHGVHVIENRKPLPNLYRMRSCDYGYSSKASVTWWEIDHDGGATAYHNLATSKRDAMQLAGDIRDIEKFYGDWDDENNRSLLAGPLDSACWNRSGLGPSIAEVMIREGVGWFQSAPKGDCSARRGMADQIRYRLRTPCGTDGHRMLRFMKRCSYLIKSLPALPADPNDMEEVNTDADDHGYDDVGYFCMSRPVTPPRPDDLGWDKDEMEDQHRKRATGRYVMS